MTYILLDAQIVETIHDKVLNPGELQGRAIDKSLDGALARVDNRLIYGMVEEIFDLAAAYAQAIACGHYFNDANKRTAYRAMIVCLKLNGVTISHGTEEAGDKIIALALRKLDDIDLARWLREKSRP